MRLSAMARSRAADASPSPRRAGVQATEKIICQAPVRSCSVASSYMASSRCSSLVAMPFTKARMGPAGTSRTTQKHSGNATTRAAMLCGLAASADGKHAASMAASWGVSAGVAWVMSNGWFMGLRRFVVMGRWPVVRCPQG